MERRALIVAIASAVLGVVLLEIYLRDFESRTSGGPKVGLLVAATDMLPGERITPAKLAVRDVPQAYVESRHVRASDRDRVVGMRLAQPQQAGEALLWTDIAGLGGQQPTLATLLRTGMRAYTLREAEGTLGALLDPGDRVDVLGRESGASQVLVQNVVVLAVGERMQPRAPEPDGLDDARSSSRSPDITLMVTPEQASELAATEARGRLRVLLRNPDDVLTRDAQTRAATGPVP